MTCIEIVLILKKLFFFSFFPQIS